jgi:hypothetical protein
MGFINDFTYIPVLSQESMTICPPKQTGASIGEQAESNFSPDIDGNDIQYVPL